MQLDRFFFGTGKGPKEKTREIERGGRDERESWRTKSERVKELTGKRRLRTGEAIMKKNGEMAIEKHEVLGRWKEYI